MATETEVAPGLTLGPQDPDGASGLTEKLGVHNKATQLLKRHRANFPPELTLALARPIDEERTEALDHAEVEEALGALRGRRAFFNAKTDTLEDASVRGRTDKDRIVSIVGRRGGDHGRSFQGVIPYASMTASVRAYEKAQKEAAAKEAGTFTVSSDDDAVALANARAAEAEIAAQEAEAKRREAEERMAEVLERLERLENPEPWEGYDNMTAKERVDMIKEGGVDEYGRAGLERIVSYEEGRSNPAVTVTRAAEEALTSTPAPAQE